jgi:hypothetical protein
MTTTRLAAFLSSLVLLVAGAARAAEPRQAVVNFDVNDLGDAPDATPGNGTCDSSPGHCTLRAAVAEANAYVPGGATITLPPGTITLGSEIVVNRSVSFVGSGSGKTFIDGANATRLFSLNTAVYVSIENLTLRNGNAGMDDGGAVKGDGTAYLTISSCHVMHCSAALGGAFYMTGGLDLTGCRVTDCHALVDTGGAIQYASGAGSTAHIHKCTLDANDAKGKGGAVHITSGYGTVYITDSTLSGNTATSAGGAVAAEGGTLQMEYSTISNNTSDIVAGGGGISVVAPATASAQYCIIAGNFEPSAQHFLLDGDCTGPLTTVGTTLLGTFGASHCQITGTHVLADALLGPLKDNGGRTPTHAVRLGSPALGASDCASASYGTLHTDQRDVDRTIDAVCDLGAFERTPCGDANLDGVVDIADIFQLINALFAGGPAGYGFMDASGNGIVDVGDVFSLINYLFAGGSIPSCQGS